jgi:hypothetical protein
VADIYDSAREKLYRAEDHLKALGSAEKRFRDTSPYSVVPVEAEPESLERVFCLELREEPPPELAALIGDAVHNIRSALDHLAYPVACRENPGLTDDEVRDIAFPIAGRSGQFKKKIKKARLATAKELAIFETVQPYKTKWPWLPLVNELDNIDKHRRLTLPVVAFERLRVEPRGLTYEGSPNYGPLVHGAEVITLRFATQPDVQVSVTGEFRVALEPIPGQAPDALPAEHTLREIIGEVAALAYRLRVGGN